MALVLYSTETWEGAPHTSIAGQAWDAGPGMWALASGGFLYNAPGSVHLQLPPNVSLAYDTLLGERGDQKIEMDVIDDAVMLVARLDRTSLQDYYLAHYEAGFVHLYKVIAGISDWLGTAPVTPTGTDVLALEAVGTAIKVRWNGVQKIGVTDATHAVGAVGIKGYVAGKLFGALRVYVDSLSITTAPPTTAAPSTLAPTTAPPTTPGPTTLAPTTSPEPTFPPTTPAPTTPSPTSPYQPTLAPTTPPPTTIAPSTAPPFTPGPVSSGVAVDMVLSYVRSEDQLVIRAWLENSVRRPRTSALDVALCELTIWSEHGKHIKVLGSDDPYGANVVRFIVPQARLWSQHLYLAEVTLVIDGDAVGHRLLPVPVN